MLKNNSGVTLMIVAVAVILLSLLAGITLNLSFRSMNDIKDNKMITELGIVRQAVVEQYFKAVSVKKVEVPISDEQVEFWVGERITNFGDVELPEKTSVTGDVEDFYDNVNSYDCEFQEDYYYRLTPNDLLQIGISESEATYVVNYSTGEVYNETIKVNSNSELLYLPGNDYMTDSGDADTFNDWD